ncbi:Uncharacterised protein [Staphylococcus aureus]|nr:Uncharacterised protein [Staphylococcus aureus]
MAFVTTIPINISIPIKLGTDIVSPVINSAIITPITVNGKENRIVNGAKPPLNVITRIKYTIMIAANIAKANCVIALLISSDAPPILTFTLFGLSKLFILDITCRVVPPTSLFVTLADTVVA